MILIVSSLSLMGCEHLSQRPESSISLTELPKPPETDLPISGTSYLKDAKADISQWQDELRAMLDTYKNLEKLGPPPKPVLPSVK
jgi:hypothetical protein